MEEQTIISPDTRRQNRVPPSQHLTERWPVLHYGSVPHIDPATWTFRLFGLVGQERQLGYEEFVALPRVKVFSDIHCVTTWSRLDNTWEGVSTRTVCDLVQVSPQARFVMVHGAHGFTTNLPLADFLAEDALFAFSHDGQPLSAEHGGPVRLVVPRLYFWKSAKWATGVEFMERDAPGFWESNGYHMRGDPWTEERYG